MATLASVQAVLFDAVGTLIYPDPPVVDVYHLAGWQHGSQLARDEVAERFRSALRRSFNDGPSASALDEAPSAMVSGGLPLNEAGNLTRPPTSEAHERQRWRQIVSQVFDDVPDAGDPLFRMLWNHFAQPEHWRVFDDVPLVISTFAERGLVLAIASNFDRRLLKIQAGHPSLQQCQRCFVSSEVGFSKPDPRYFAAVEQQLGLPADAILLVGDDWENDYLGAQAAGWHAVHLGRQGSRARHSGLSSLHELCAFPLGTG